MKIYATEHIGWLIGHATTLLREEGYRNHELPYWEIKRDNYSTRSVRLSAVKGALPVSPYYRADLYLSTDPLFHTVHANHQPNRRGQHDHGEKAATWNQWGLVLGALFDVASERNIEVRVSGYDPLAKYAPLHPVTGERFDNSDELFTHQTVGQFIRPMRVGKYVNMTCRQHKWSFPANLNGTVSCTKCGTKHRFWWPTAVSAASVGA